MTERRVLPDRLSAAAEILETRFEEVLAAYEELLLAIESPLVTEAQTREQLKMHARSTLEEVVSNLHGREAPPGMQQSEDRISKTVGASRASGNVHASESLRAGVALSEATLSVVVENLPPSPTSTKEVAAVALIVQETIVEHIARTDVAYSSYLLEKVHESHADERRRISRELHDRVAHSIMVAFRNLEFFEFYRVKDPSKAQARLELVKSTTQEALELTRSLSRELRETPAQEGLEVALTDLLKISVPHGIRAWVSVEGDESLIAPQVRDELFLILREGVSNAITHSEARTIKVELETTEDHVRGAVEDDGRGFEPGEGAVHDGGTGLTSMKERTSLLGGTLLLTSGLSKGTRIEVFVPLPRNRR